MLANSEPGAAVVMIGADVINMAWAFLLSIQPYLPVLAACVGTDLSWLTALSHYIDQVPEKFKD